MAVLGSSSPFLGAFGVPFTIGLTRYGRDRFGHYRNAVRLGTNILAPDSLCAPNQRSLSLKLLIEFFLAHRRGSLCWVQYEGLAVTSSASKRPTRKLVNKVSCVSRCRAHLRKGASYKRMAVSSLMTYACSAIAFQVGSKWAYVKYYFPYG